MRAKRFICCVAAVTWALLAGCGEPTDSPAKSKAEIVGKYEGHYADGLEMFDLHADGTFAQAFRGSSNAGYTSTGTWLYESNTVWDGKTYKISRITFKPFMLPSGLSICTSNTKIDVSPGNWLRNPVRIELGPWPYFARKVQNEGADKS